MLIFLLLFQIIILCICVLCHKMIEKRYKDIEESIKILNDPRAYRTHEKIHLIKNIIDKYQSYIENDKEQVDLVNIIKVDLLKSNIGQFKFVGIYNVATKLKILTRYSVLMQIIILYVNGDLKSVRGLSILGIGVGLAILIEVLIIVKALDKKHENIILVIAEYIRYKYPVEVERRNESNKNVKDSNIHKKNIEDNNACSETGRYTNSNVETNNITEKDIANVIRRINLYKEKNSSFKI